VFWGDKAKEWNFILFIQHNQQYNCTYSKKDCKDVHSKQQH